MTLKKLPGGAWVNRAAPQRSTRSALGHSRSVSQPLSHPLPPSHRKWPRSLHRWCLIPVWTMVVWALKGHLLQESRGGRGGGEGWERTAGWRSAAQRAAQCAAGMQGCRQPGGAHRDSKQDAVLNLRGMRTRRPCPLDKDQGTVSTPRTSACLGLSVFDLAQSPVPAHHSRDAMGQQHGHGCLKDRGRVSGLFPRPGEHLAGPLPTPDTTHLWERTSLPTTDGQLMLW